MAWQTIDTKALRRHATTPVAVRWGKNEVVIGGNAPIVVQSMTNTLTTDVRATVEQIRALSRAGSELVRLTINTPEAARATVAIRSRLDQLNESVPLVGDFHYNGHKLLTEVSDCAWALSKYRINPGNVGKGEKAQENFAAMIACAKETGAAVRIGVNGGSIDQCLLRRLLEENRCQSMPKHPHYVFLRTMVQSALRSARQARQLGLPRDRIVLSTKVSSVPDLIEVYEALAQRSSYALHLGLTEAGIGSKGIVASSAALAVLLSRGIGDTIRVSLTPMPGTARTEEVVVAQEILQSMGFRDFMPMVTSCPGCGRTSSTLFQTLAARTQQFLRDRMPVWREEYIGVECMKVAVMGCVVNGPGESRQADIGISLPGTGEMPVAPVYVRGEKVATLKGAQLQLQFQNMIEEFVAKHYQRRNAQ